MDRLPRKAFLVAGDAVCGIAYALLGLWLLWSSFSYVGYLVASLVIACLESVDELAWASVYPNVIPEGAEQKGYAVSSMLYTTIAVVTAPFAALLLDAIGVPLLLVVQAGLSLAAAFIESFAHVREHASDQSKRDAEPFTLTTWARDIRETIAFLAEEDGLRALFTYMAISNGVGMGYGPILIAFFRTAPGMSAAMYALFSGAECIGRTLGSAVQYRVRIPKERRFGLTFFVYQVYNLMDACLLWLPYPLMLVNRGMCGFLGGNSSIMREAAVQRYIPEHMRSRVNAFQDAAIMAASSSLALLVGMLGELLDYRICLTICGAAGMAASWLAVWRRRQGVRRVFEAGE